MDRDVNNDDDDRLAIVIIIIIVDVDDDDIINCCRPDKIIIIFVPGFLIKVVCSFCLVLRFLHVRGVVSVTFFLL